MSTPRKRWFRVYESILRESWDNDTLASAVRLWAWLNGRWASDGITHEEAGRAVIGSEDAMKITRRRRPHEALQRLASLPLVARWSSASATLDDPQHPTSVTLTWDKFPKLQEYGSRSRGSDGPDTGESLPPPIPTPSSSSKTQKKNTRAPRSAGPKPAAEAIRIFCEEYKAAKGVNPAIPPKDKRELGEALADLGPEQFRAAVVQFMRMDDDWIRERAHAPRAFLHALPMCSLRAQRQAARQQAAPPEPAPAPEWSPEDKAAVRSLFPRSQL